MKNDTCDHPTTNSRHIGFIIHEQCENQRTALSYLQRVGSHIPLLKNICGGGRHWYAITRIRHHSDESGPQPKKNTNDAVVYNTGDVDQKFWPWYLVDSNLNDVSMFNSEEELNAYLRKVQRGGRLVFRASYIATPTDDKVVKNGKPVASD